MPSHLHSLDSGERVESQVSPRPPTEEQSLDQQLIEFRRNKFLAMPIAGAVAWSGIAIASIIFDSTFAKCMSVFVGTGSIFYLGLVVARFTGENLMRKKGDKNYFDTIFLYAVAQAVGVYAIAIPFFMLEAESLPMSVGILTGLMWLPFSALVGHWVGIFHASIRTGLILVIWYVFPDFRFAGTAIAIVGVYLITIMLLLQRKLP